MTITQWFWAHEKTSIRRARRAMARTSSGPGRRRARAVTSKTILGEFGSPDRVLLSVQ